MDADLLRKLAADTILRRSGNAALLERVLAECTSAAATGSKSRILYLHMNMHKLLMEDFLWALHVRTGLHAEEIGSTGSIIEVSWK